MDEDKRSQIVILLSVAAVLGVNALANSLPLNGQTTGEIADRFQVYFTPADYAFSIWGLIYAGLVAFAIYQAQSSQADHPRLRRITPLVVTSSLANIAWVFLWHYEFIPLSLAAMLILLASLAGLYQQLEIGQTPVSRAEKWLVQVPFSLYLGWVTVATIANATVVLAYLNWNGWGISPEIWGTIMLLAGLAIAVVVSLPREDIAFLLVVAWGFVAIGVKYPAVPVFSNTAWVTAAAAVGMAASIWTARRRPTPDS